jgi:TonB-dependent starch-binding outer membrane protein SusC
MMDKSYISNHFSGCVGLVGQSQPQSFVQKALSSFLAMLVMVMLLGNQAAWAQERTVTGKVTDATGSVLPGVSIQVKGTTRGANTNADGVYTLTGVGDNATLVFSFIGYTSQEVVVGNRSTVDVQLADDTKALQEVVVVGYGTQKQKDITGGIVALGPKDFNQGVIASPEQLLQGRAAGVQITPSSGEPGAGINIQIRGSTSVRSNSNPLYVIDGVPLDGGDVSAGGQDFGGGTTSARNPLNFLNPNDIENISVLKDASSAAIYGSRGANGVVLITTKRGKAGSQQVNLSASTSISSPLRRYDLLNGPEFVAGVVAAGGDRAAVDRGANTDWQKEVFRTSISQNYNLSFGGGNQDTRYLFSVGYSDQQGIIKKAALQRLVGRINASHELFNDKVILDLSLTTSGVKDTYVLNTDNAGAQGNLIGAMIQANPSNPVRNPDGSFFYAPPVTNADGTISYPRNSGDYRNPAAILDLIDDDGNTNRTLASVSGTWRILDGLSAKINFGLDASSAVRRTSIDPNLGGFNDTFNRGRAYIQNRYRTSRLIEYTLNYGKTVGPGVLDAVAGFSYQKFENRGDFVRAEFFTTSLIPLVDNLDGVNNNDNKAFLGGSDRSQNELQSYFGRVNYNLSDKYILTATLRVDGSSRFGANNKYGYFPSVGAAWRLSNENFIPKNVFDDLKLRLNYGITGSQDFQGGASRVLFTANTDGSLTQNNNPNPNLRWEQTTQYGAGLDFTVLKGRLSGTLDYFYKSTTDLLFQIRYAQPAAVTYRFINLPGNVINNGVELGLAFQAVQKAKFGWEILANATFLKNTIKNFGSTNINTGAISGQGLSGAYAQTFRDGNSIFSFNLPTFTGFGTTSDGIQNVATYANDGVASIVGNPIPKYNLGLTNNFTFGRLTASFFVNGQFGAYIYNNTANALFLKGILRNGRNVTRDVAASAENPLNVGSPSTRFLEKIDFVRLSNANIGYTFDLPQGGFAKSLRVSLTGQNLLLFTGYTGLDPEVNTNKSIDGVPSRGIDYTAFPTPRTFTVGLNVGF